VVADHHRNHGAALAYPPRPRAPSGLAGHTQSQTQKTTPTQTKKILSFFVRQCVDIVF